MKFRAKVVHPLTGRQMRVSAASKVQLSALLAHVDTMRAQLRVGMMSETEVATKLRRLRGGASTTLRQAVVVYLARPTLTRNTKRRTESMLVRHMGDIASLTLLELDASRVSMWLEQRALRLTSGSVSVLWWTLRAVMRYALERGLVDRCPWGTWKPTFKGQVSMRPPKEAARHMGELQTLLNAAYELDDEDGRARGPKIAVAALLGLRQGELAGLQWPDVDFDAGAVTIRRGADGPTKGRRVDVLLAHQGLFNALSMWMGRLRREELYAPKGPVFPCPWRSSPGAVSPFLDGSPVLTARELRQAVRRAGLPNPDRWTPHSLRASFVTIEVRESGGDLVAAKERTRHATIGGLVRYLRAHTREPAPPRVALAPSAVPKRLASRGAP